MPLCFGRYALRVIAASHYRDLLRDIISGQRWIVAFDVLAGATPFVEQLQALGAGAVMCIAASRGTGPVPDPARVPSEVLEIRHPDLMTALRASEAALAALPDEVAAKVDAFDPDRTARAIGTLFSAGAPVAGRPMFGARSPAQQALEDKIIIDALWDEIGMARAPSAIVPAEPDALAEAARTLDRGSGTVWAADNKRGWHGGAHGLCWVRDDDSRRRGEALAADCDVMRVMPFLEGTPCSIHGIVLPNDVVVLRPCEMVVLRRGSELIYSRVATFWDPPPADREDMRAIARRLGEHLRERVDYRGAFTLDGVMTAEGFRPTELNPRYGAALNVQSKALPELPLFLLNMAIVEGVEADYRPRELEQLLLTSADDNRRGGGGLVVPQSLTEDVRARLCCTGERWRLAEQDEPHDAELLMGPSPAGGFVKIDMLPERTPIGPPVAPRVVAALRFVDTQYELGIGVLQAARES